VNQRLPLRCLSSHSHRRFSAGPVNGEVILNVELHIQLSTEPCLEDDGANTFDVCLFVALVTWEERRVTVPGGLLTRQPRKKDTGLPGPLGNSHVAAPKAHRLTHLPSLPLRSKQ